MPDATDFLSEEELLRIRGLTTLLYATNGIDNGTQNGCVSYDFNTRGKTNRLYRGIAKFNDLLVRHSEAVAVRSATRSGCLIQIFAESEPDRDEDETGDASSEVENEDDVSVGRVYYAAKSGPETDKKNGIKKSSVESRVAPLFVEVTSEPTEPMTSAGAWLLEHTTGVKNKSPKTDITLQKHGAMLVSLVIGAHDAPDEAAWENASTQLNQYALLASVAKVRGRIVRGKAAHDRNLFKFLTMRSRHVRCACPTEQEIQFKPSSAEDTKLPGFLLRSICEYLEDGKTGLAPELEPWLSGRDVTYTAETRPIFQTLLGSLLAGIDDAILRLVKTKHKRLMEKGLRENAKIEACEGELASAAAELDWDAGKACRWLSFLSCLMGRVPFVMEAHLRYLQDVFTITEVKRGEKQWAELAASPNYPADADFAEIDSAGFRGEWHLAALEYLDLISLHQIAAASLGRFSFLPTAHDKMIREFLRCARVEYVRCQQDQADKNMMSMKRVMETLTSFPGNPIGLDNVAKVKSFVQNHHKKDGKPVISDAKWVDEKNFEGRIHCESVLLSLMLLRQTALPPGKATSDQESETPYSQLPPQAVMNKFADCINVLPVSMLCCPACYALIKYVEDERCGDQKLPHPGHHEKWVPMALPPWIPRDVGLAVIKAAETRLVRRIKKLQACQDANSG